MEIIVRQRQRERQREMLPAVNLVVGSVTDTGAVQRLGAEDTPEAVAVIVTAGGHHLLCSEHFPPAPGAARGLVISQYGRGVYHPGSGRDTLNTLQSISTQQGGPSLAKPIALDTVNLPVAS